MLRFNKSLSAVNSEAAWLHLKFNLPLVGEGGGGREIYRVLKSYYFEL